MTLFPVRLTIIVFALFFTTVAQGQSSDWYVVPSIVYTNDDADRNIDDSLAGGQIVVGRNILEYLSVEGLLGYSSIKGFKGPAGTTPDQKHFDLSVNLLAYYNRDRAFAPYLMVGVGYLGVDADEGPPYLKHSINDNNPTASVGLGFKWRMGQSKFSIRGEHRFRTALDWDNLTDQLTTIGVQYNFGGRPAPAVNALAVSANESLDRDGDGDRVFDTIDECPNTPTGAAVDPRGCSLDSDMDGVTTGKDRCPATRAGAEVDIYGCEKDTDSDGVPNHLDRCPDTRAGARIDANGCELKDIISLPGVNFETSFDILLPGTEYVLQEAANTLNRYPELQIEVAGHSDDVGNAASNEGLSERRAKTVRYFLINYGVAADRLTFRGYGESQPIADNSTAEGRATNRRVELRLVNRETQ